MEPYFNNIGRKSDPAVRDWRLVLVVATALCGFAALVQIFWIGFLGSDDSLYWSGASGWLSRFPYVGGSHWSLRHTVVLPIAISRLLLGDKMSALILPTLLYAGAAITISAIWTHSVFGIRSAISASALVITNPQFVLLSSTADVDIPEIFFVLAAFYLLHGAMDLVTRGSSCGNDVQGANNTLTATQLLLLAGALIALAILTRETSVFAIATIAILFCVGYGMKRYFYVVMGFGFFAVSGLELGYVWSMTGSPLYRFDIALHHDNSINRWVDQGASIPFVHPLVDPLNMLLLNHNFALIAWLGIPLTIWLARQAKAMRPSARRMIALVAILAITWTALAAGLWSLLTLIPRYYLLPSIGVSVLSGIALAQLWQNGRARLAGFLFGLLVVGNLLALSLDNRNYMFGEQTLRNLASMKLGIIHTDPQTLRRAALLLEWNKVRDRVTSDPPSRGDLFFYNPARAGSHFLPGTRWTVVARQSVPKGGLQGLLCDLLPLKTLLPSTRLHRCESQSVVLYRSL